MFSTTFRAITITIQLINTPFINISYYHQKFTSHFLQQTQQHFVPKQSSLYFQILGLLGWYFQTNKCWAIDFQIELGWIQTKSVHLLYQNHMVFNNNEIKFALIKSWKWSTQSSIIVIPISQEPLINTSSLISRFSSKVFHVFF